MALTYHARTGSRGETGPLDATEVVRTLLALTCCAWSYVPSFLLVEVSVSE